MTDAELGPFLLEERIGKGGMGEVWRGRHRVQGSVVAIKVITPRWAREHRFVEALWREVEACARLTHRGIVSVLDFGEIPYSTASATFGAFHAGSPYFVMEHVAGHGLSYRRRPWSQTRELLRRLLDAMAHAHARGVIHRDLKPSNVLIDEAVRPRVTDFGLAHVQDGGRSGPEEISGASGTPGYMAPEQILGDWREQGPWTDLYSLGCIAHGLVKGTAPYVGPMEDVLQAHLHAPPPRVDESAPHGFDDWLSLMMAKDVRHRYRRAADACWGLLQLPADGGALEEVSDEPFEDSDGVDIDGMLTLSVFTRSLQTLVDVSPDIDESAATTEYPRLRPTPPPIPDSWAIEEAPIPIEILGAGLGIFGLRTIPLVGRRAERDVIWEELLEVASTNSPRAVVLRGDAGTGKSRLTEWIGERAHELGAATLLRAVHSPMRGAHDGIGPMIAHALRLDGLAAAEVNARIFDFFARTGGDPAELFTGEALTSIVVGEADGHGGPRLKFSSATQRWAAVVELLGRMAQERPVFLWLDDVQWGADALGLCQHILDRPSPGRIFVVLTVRNEGLRDRTTEALRLEKVLSHDRCTTVRVGPLAERHRMGLVRLLLGLESDAARQVAEHTSGNPLFAVQLVGDWIERNALELRPTGFGLRDDVALEVPDDIHALWQRRLEHVVGALAEETRADARRALELAAALGQDIDEAELRAVAQAAGIRLPRNLVSALVSHRLAVRTPRGWAFAHGMFRESLELDSRAAGRWTETHALCARVLADRLLPPELWRRLADHLLAAEEWTEALEPIRRQALRGFDLGDYEEGGAALDLLAATSDAAGLAEDDAWRAREWTLRARLMRETRDLDRAREYLDRAEPIARKHGAGEIVAELLGTRASLATLAGDLERARELVDESLENWRRVGDRVGEAHALRTRNWLLFWSGDYEGAQEALIGAEAAYEAASDLDGLGWVHYESAAIALHTEDLERATELTESATRLFEAVGNVVALADCYNMRGEIARARGDVAQAEDWYREALVIYEPLGHANELVARENLGLTLLAAGRFDAAEEILTTALAANEALGRAPFVVRLCAELIECAAGAADVASWTEYYEQFERAAATTAFADYDSAAALERAGESWLKRGDETRARRALEDSRTLWGRLNREDRQEAIDAKLDEVRGSRP